MLLRHCHSKRLARLMVLILIPLLFFTTWKSQECLNESFTRINRIHCHRVQLPRGMCSSFVIKKQTKHGYTILSLPTRIFIMDITISMDVESNPGPNPKPRGNLENLRPVSAKNIHGINLGNCAETIALFKYSNNNNHQHTIPVLVTQRRQQIVPRFKSSFRNLHYIPTTTRKNNPTANLEINQNQRKATHLKIAHLNIQSLKNRNHFLQLKDLIFHNDFDILTISETLLNSTVSNASIQLDGYNLVRLDRKYAGKSYNGVCAYVRTVLKFQVLHDLSEISDTGFHQLWLKIQHKKLSSFLVCAAYRPPSECPISFLYDDLSPRLTQALTFNHDVIITGDLNCDLLKEGTESRTFTEFYQTFNLKQIITSPTRISKSAETLLDIILVSNPNIVITRNVLETTISDHYLVSVTLNLKRPKILKKEISARTFKTYDKQKFSSDLAQVPWQTLGNLGDIDSKAKSFHDLFTKILDLHAPIRTFKVKPKPVPFITKNIKNLMKTRDSLLRQYRLYHDPQTWEKFKSLRQQVKIELKAAESNYYQSEIKQNARNSSSMWKVIRSCLPSKDTQSKTYEKDNAVVAKQFNEYFVSVGTKTALDTVDLATKFNVEIFNPLHTIIIPEINEEEKFSFKTVTCEQVKRIIQSFPSNKSPGMDKISISVLKDCIKQIIKPVTHIINFSLSSNNFPNIWKCAEVIPIHKAGNHEVPQNNRPISLLPVISKIAEKIAQSQIVEYLTKNDKLTSKQSGNKKNCSTETLSVHITDFIIENMDKKNLTAMVLLDLSKAFDSIDYEILLHKLEAIGFSRSALDWIKSYLAKRTQCVRIDNTLSSPLPITAGVPQGSILGPLLFNIYMNDLPSISITSNLDSYVDDTKIYLPFSINNLQSAKSTIQNDLNCVASWCLSNKLLINPTKTQLIIFGVRQLLAHAPEFKLSFLDQELSPSSSVKDLGLLLDAHLSFNEHIKKVSSSCCSTLSQINRVKHVFDKKTLLTIINTLVFSKLYYCSCVWSGTSQTNIIKLQQVQNYAARIISGKRKYDHISPVLNSLKWVSVKDQLFLRDATLAFKCLNGLAPKYLSTRFLQAQPNKERPRTRNSNNLYIQRCRITMGQRSFLQRASRIWNNLDQSLKQPTHITLFKHRLKNKVKNNNLD